MGTVTTALPPAFASRNAMVSGPSHLAGPTLLW